MSIRGGGNQELPEADRGGEVHGWFRIEETFELEKEEMGLASKTVIISHGMDSNSEVL